jgi:hypothetical protein
MHFNNLLSVNNVDIAAFDVFRLTEMPKCEEVGLYTSGTATVTFIQPNSVFVSVVGNQ